MFNCYLHGWSSRDDTCPKCIKIETVTTTTGTYPDYIVGISGQELERLRAENSRLREALEILAAENSVTCCQCSDVKDIARAALEDK
jgi:hypothetical protein